MSSDSKQLGLSGRFSNTNRDGLASFFAAILVLLGFGRICAAQLSWTLTEIDSAVTSTQAQPELVIGSDGTLHIAYFSDGALKHAKRTPSGTWTRQTVVASAGPGQRLSLAIDSAGNPRIAWETPGSPSNPPVRYVEHVNGAWSSMMTPGNGEEPCLAIDSTGKVHLTFGVYLSATKHMTHIPDTTTWQAQSNAVNSFPWWPSIAINPINDLPVILCNNGNLYYREYNGSSWTGTLVSSDPGPGFGLNPHGLVLNLSTGQPSALFYNSSNQVKYAYRDGSGWHIEVPSLGTSGYTQAIQLDPAGQPNILYANPAGAAPFELKFARKNTTGTWEVFTVQQAAVTGSAACASLLLKSTGLPLVAFSKFVGGQYKPVLAELTNAPPARIHIPSLAAIDTPGDAPGNPDDERPIPIRITLTSPYSQAITSATVHVRLNKSDPLLADLDNVQPDPSLPDRITNRASDGFDFQFDWQPGETVELGAIVKLPRAACTNQPLAGRLVWSISGQFGPCAWPDPAVSGLSSFDFVMTVLPDPTCMPEDRSGVDEQGTCPTEMCVGNGLMAATLSREGKIVYASYPTVGSYTQIPYETRPPGWITKHLDTAGFDSAPFQNNGYAYGAPLPMGVFPGLRIRPAGDETWRVTWLACREWCRSPWRHVNDHSPIGTMTYHDLHQQIMVTETVYVPMVYPSNYNSAIIRVFDITNISGSDLELTALCSALVQPNRYPTNPYLDVDWVKLLVGWTAEFNWNWRTTQASLSTDGKLVLLENVADAASVTHLGAIGAAWLPASGVQPDAPTPFMGVRGKTLTAGTVGTTIIRGTVGEDNEGFDLFYSAGALSASELGENPLTDVVIEPADSAYPLPPEISHVVTEWGDSSGSSPTLLEAGETQRLAIVLAFEEPATIETSVASLLGYANDNLTATSDAWEQWLDQDTLYGQVVQDGALDDEDEERLLARSLVTMRLMRNQGTQNPGAQEALGSIVASPNLQPKYWPVWPRDGLFQGLAWMMAGRIDYLEDMLSWCFREGASVIVPRNPSEAAESQMTWIQAYDPITGSSAGLPGILKSLAPVVGLDWSDLFLDTNISTDEPIEYDQPSIVFLVLKTFYEQAGYRPNGMSWADIVAVANHVNAKLQPRAHVGGSANLFLPASIDWGEDPRYDIGLSFWANTAALGALHAVDSLFTDLLESPPPDLDEPTRQDMEAARDAARSNKDMLTEAITENLWKPDPLIIGLVPLTKMYYPADVPVGLPSDPEGWTQCDAPSLVADTDRPLSFDMYKSQTMHIWPFAAWPIGETNTLDFYLFKLRLYLNLPASSQNGMIQPERVWSVPFLGCAIYERLLSEESIYGFALPFSNAKLRQTIGDYYTKVDNDEMPETSYLTDAGYIPDVLMKGYPGAVTGSKPLGWTHAMAVMALLQKAGYPLPVSLRQTAPADFDKDGDVDATDLDHFIGCALGPAVAQDATDCQDAKLDNDTDVDQSDFGIFQRCLSGENSPADPNCAN